MNAPDIADRAVYATYPDVEGIEFLSKSRSRDKFDAHMHEYFTIGITTEGAERFWCRNAEHAASAGDIAIVNPFEVHKGGPGPAGFWSYRMVYATSGAMDAVTACLFDSPQSAPQFQVTVVTDPALAGALASLQTLMDNASSSLERQSLVLNTLGGLILRHGYMSVEQRRVGLEPDAIRITREYLNDNFAGNVTLQELSALCGLSPFHLLRTFHRIVGMPPHAYLRQIRVERAKQMMAAGADISEAALAAGFSDQSHLTRFFKRLLGMTPGEYASGLRLSASRAAYA